jgi:hypothetical protein
MQLSEAPRRELEKAKVALKAMSESKSLDELEEQWLECLGRLERIAYKLQAAYKKSPRWGNWAPRFNLMRDDPLITYLTRARGADEHSIEPVVHKHNPMIPGFRNDSDRPVSIRAWLDDRGNIYVQTDGDIKVEFHPEFMVLKSIVFRGVTYSPPEQYRGKLFESDDILKMSQVAIAEYEKLIADAEAFFVK